VTLAALCVRAKLAAIPQGTSWRQILRRRDRRADSRAPPTSRGRRLSIGTEPRGLENKPGIAAPTLSSPSLFPIDAPEGTYRSADPCQSFIENMHPAGSFPGAIPTLQQFAAYFCLILGTVGLVVPVLPGIPVLLLGFKLLGARHRLTRRAAMLWLRLRSRIWRERNL
jgi:hypothetical protein